MKYELRVREDGKQAIFDEHGNMITKEWYDGIEPEGLLMGQSKFFIVKKDGKMAIFDIDGNMITNAWYDIVFPYGLVMGCGNSYMVYDNTKSEYVIIAGKTFERFTYRYAHFDVHGNMITDWKDDTFHMYV